MAPFRHKNLSYSRMTHNQNTKREGRGVNNNRQSRKRHRDKLKKRVEIKNKAEHYMTKEHSEFSISIKKNKHQFCPKNFYERREVGLNVVASSHELRNVRNF